MTTIINLFAQPSAGKTTTASHLNTILKFENVNSEWRQEYVKDWAYEKRNIKPHDQCYIMAKEIKRQMSLIGVVDYVISDSPFLLCPFYQEHYGNKGARGLLTVAKDHIDMSIEQGAKIFNFFLVRNKAYNPVGRYQTEEESNKVGTDLQKWLDRNLIPYVYLDCPDIDRAKHILKIVGHESYVKDLEDSRRNFHAV